MQHASNAPEQAKTSRNAARRRPVRGLAAFALAIAMTFGITVGTTAPAFADHGISTIGDVNLRSGPGTQYEVLAVVPSGTSPTYLCWERGEDIHGVSVWFRVEYGTVGYITSWLDDSSYASADDIAGKYGIEPCRSDASAEPEGAIADESSTALGNDAPYSCTGPDDHGEDYDGWAACQWAVHNALSESRFPTNDCTWFVSQALWEGGLAQTDTWTGASFDVNQLATNNPSAPGFGYPGPTSTATKANTLVDYLVGNGLATRTPIDWSDNTAAGAQIGDIIAYHWNRVGPNDDPSVDFVDHLSMVTGFEGTYPLVSQHTSQQLNRGWSWSINGNDWIEFAARADDPSIEPKAWLIHIN